MKLIALKDFANNFGLEVEDPLHERHVHAGAIFDIGQGKTLEELRKKEVPAAMLVAQLTVAGCVGDATDEKVVKAVKESVAQDRKREETAKKLQQAADGSALVAQLTALLQKAASAAPAKPRE